MMIYPGIDSLIANVSVLSIRSPFFSFLWSTVTNVCSFFSSFTSSDLPELTGVIVPTEYLSQRMKTYSFIETSVDFSSRASHMQWPFSWVTSWQSPVTTHLWEHGCVSGNWHLNGLFTHCVALRCQHLCLPLTESQLWWIWHCRSLALLHTLKKSVGVCTYRTQRAFAPLFPTHI